MSLEETPPLETRPLVRDIERRAVLNWLRRINPEDLEEEMLLYNDLGTSFSETVLGILMAWADAGHQRLEQPERLGPDAIRWDGDGPGAVISG